MTWPAGTKVLGKFLVLSIACSIAMMILVRMECPPRVSDILITNRSGREVSNLTLLVSEERGGAKETHLISGLEPDSTWDLATKLSNDVTYDATIRWSDGRVVRDTIRAYLDNSTPNASMRIDSTGLSLDVQSSEKF